MKYFSLLIIFLIAIACAPPKETVFSTKTLHLSGDIKHITQTISNGYPKTIEIEFINNSVHSIKTFGPDVNYLFNYEGDRLINITGRSTEIKPEEFPLSYQLMQPLLMYNADSVILNEHQDPIHVFFKSDKEHAASEYRIEYTYDTFHNWVVRELFYFNSESALERTKRTILYTRRITNNEITEWNIKSDSVFNVARDRNFLITTIDSTIGNDQVRMKKMMSHLTTHYQSVVATYDTLILWTEKFSRIYGHENLSPELEEIKNKLTILQGITQREEFLWKEAQVVIPWLMTGKKKVTDNAEPFEGRYMLTYTNELIEDIIILEKRYSNVNSD